MVGESKDKKSNEWGNKSGRSIGPGTDLGLALEPSPNPKSGSDSAKISAEIFAQTLQHFVKIVPQIRGFEKNLCAKKFVKNIIYSKEDIAVTLYYKNASEKELSLSTASGRVGAATGRRRFLDLDKKISLTGTCKANGEDWLLVCDDIRTYFKGNL